MHEHPNYIFCPCQRYWFFAAAVHDADLWMVVVVLCCDNIMAGCWCRDHAVESTIKNGMPVILFDNHNIKLGSIVKLLERAGGGRVIISGNASSHCLQLQQQGQQQ